MDNDNPLLQKAADLYRGLRFTMKYRGVDILPAAAGNDLARDLLESGQPFLFGRCGATEMRTVADWLQNGGHNFTDRTRGGPWEMLGGFSTHPSPPGQIFRPLLHHFFFSPTVARRAISRCGSRGSCT